MMFKREKLCEVDESARGTHIAVDIKEGVYVTLVDYANGSKLEEKLKTLEHKLDSIFALLMERGR